MPTKPGKYIGEYTARGIVSEADTQAGNPQKIPLYDGRADTAYRVTGFKIWGSTGSSGMDTAGKLSKNDDGVTAQTNFFRADDHNQIAWAGSDGFGDIFQTEVSIVDPDNLVIEDLYIYVRCNNSAGGSEPINYLVMMEKYQIDEWKGALTMARDRAQGDL